MKEKILSIVPEAILEEKHGIWFVSVPRTSFHDLALRLRNDEDTSFDFLVCMTGMDWGETLGVMYHLRSSKYGHDLALRVETENRENPELPSVSDIWATANLNEREVFDFYGIRSSSKITFSLSSIVPSFVNSRVGVASGLLSLSRRMGLIFSSAS